MQWVGLFGAGVTWAAMQVLAFGVNVARCGAGSGGWWLPYHPVQAVLIGVSFLLALGAEAAAVLVLLETRSASYDGPAPEGRRQFFAIAAALGNFLFLDAIVLSAIGALTHTPCLTS